VNDNKRRHAADGIEIVGNLLRSVSLRALIIITLPVLLVMFWLAVLREPAIKSQMQDVVSQSILSQQTAVLEAQVSQLFTRLEAIAHTVANQDDRVRVAIAFPEAAEVDIFTLDEMGTAPLAPGGPGLDNHVTIDLIRRAFDFQLPGPEGIEGISGWFVGFARPYPNNDAPQGVILLRLPPTRLSRGQSHADGQFALLQQLNNEIPITILGDRAIASRYQARVPNTPWILRFEAHDDWLHKAIPTSWVLWLTMLIGFAGLIFGSLILLRDLPKSLREEVLQLLAAAESKGRFRLRVPELHPLIALFSKMTPETRRQLVASVRLSAPETEPEKSSAKASTVAEGAEIASGETEEADFPRHLFRSTDIYGHAERELHDGLLERLAHAAALTLRKQGTQALIVARDNQMQSKRVATTMIKCLLSAGIDIIDLGEASRPVLAFATHEMPHDSGLLIGARLDSKTHLSLQFMVKGAALTREQMTDIITAAISNVREHGDGRLIKHSAMENYLDKLALDISISAPLDVVLGGAQDHTLALAETVITSLGCSVTRAADTSATDLKARLSSMASDVVSASADIGLWFGADGSEFFAITNQGRIATADQLFLLFAEETLSRNPGGDVLFDTLCSRHIPSAVARLGGRASQVRPGGAFLERATADRAALLAGGFAGSFVIAERWYATADGLYAAARLVELLSMHSQSFDELLTELPSSTASPMWIIPMDINARTRILRALTAQSNFPKARVSREGGLRLDYPDAWGAICELESQDAIGIRFEGANEAAANSVKSALTQALLNAEPGLSLPF